MVDIQSAAAEIRRGKKRKKKEERTNHSMKIYMVSLLHRATIIRLQKIGKYPIKYNNEQRTIVVLQKLYWECQKNTSSAAKEHRKKT